MLQGDVYLAALLVMQHRMPMTEGTALGVLPGETNRRAISQDGREGQRLRLPPIDAARRIQICSSALQEAGEPGVWLEARRPGQQFLVEGPQLLRRDSWRQLLLGLGELLALLLRLILSTGNSITSLLSLAFRLLKLSHHLPHHALGLLHSDDSLSLKLAGIDLTHSRMRANQLIEHRLGEARLIALVMPPAPVSHQIDQNIFEKLILIGKGQRS